MLEAETTIEMVERHVEVGRRIVREQSKLIHVRRREGRDVVEAEQLLGTFEDLQRLHVEHLERLKEN
jgi:hypothetical protein